MFERFYETEGFKIEDILEEYYEYGQQVQTICLRYIRCIE